MAYSRFSMSATLAASSVLRLCIRARVWSNLGAVNMLEREAVRQRREVEEEKEGTVEKRAKEGVEGEGGWEGWMDIWREGGRKGGREGGRERERERERE